MEEAIPTKNFIYFFIICDLNPILTQILKEVTWRMEHSRYFFFLANGAGAINSYCRELLSPQTGIAALTLTVMKDFEAKKG